VLRRAGSVGGNDHARHRRCGSLFTSCPLEQGPPHRLEAPAEAKGGLGNPHSASARRASTRPRSVQLALDSKLRGCDLVRLQVNDVCVGGRLRDRATVIQRKTSRPVQFEITEQTRAAIRDWVANSVPGNGQYLFPSRFHDQPHISTRQYARIVHHWVERAGLDSSAYGTHSMRRTKAAQIYKKTGNLRAVQLLLETTTNCPRTPDRGADLLFVPSPVRRDRTDSQAIRLSRRRARRHSAAGRVERLHTGVDDARGSGALQAVC
jgi:Phage integrase family